MEKRHEEGPAAVSRFRELKGRPTPEVDASLLWRRIEAGLAPRKLPLRRRFVSLLAPRFAAGAFPRLAYGVAAAVIVVATVWIGAQRFALPREAQLVLLAPADTSGISRVAEVPVELPLSIEVRLIRGFDGVAPDDVASAAAMSLAGVDPLFDADPEIASLPFERFGVVGAGRGRLMHEQPLGVDLSDEYRFEARTIEMESDSVSVVRLRDIELKGSDWELVGADLALEPGRLYRLGVLPAGVETPTLFLLIRAQSATDPR